MPALNVSYCSSALLLIGAGGISSFEEGDKAQVAGALYEDTLRALLSAYPWRFTMKKQQLARHTAPPRTEWRYQFQRPSDCLLLRAVRASAAIGAPPLKQYEVFEGNVLANVEQAWADYQHRPDEALFPAYFVQALKYNLAAVFAKPITEETALAEFWDKAANAQTLSARRADAQQQPPQQIQDFTLIGARFGG